MVRHIPSGCIWYVHRKPAVFVGVVASRLILSPVLHEKRTMHIIYVSFKNANMVS